VSRSRVTRFRVRFLNYCTLHTPRTVTTGNRSDYGSAQFYCGFAARCILPCQTGSSHPRPSLSLMPRCQRHVPNRQSTSLSPTVVNAAMPTPRGKLKHNALDPRSVEIASGDPQTRHSIPPPPFSHAVGPTFSLRTLPRKIGKDESMFFYMSITHVHHPTHTLVTRRESTASIN
jgi:hypothetical protein